MAYYVSTAEQKSFLDLLDVSCSPKSEIRHPSKRFKKLHNRNSHVILTPKSSPLMSTEQISKLADVDPDSFGSP
jgi:hypothetical protein